LNGVRPFYPERRMLLYVLHGMEDYPD